MNQEQTLPPDPPESEESATSAPAEPTIQAETVPPGEMGDATEASQSDAGGRGPGSQEAEIASLRAKVDSHWDKLLRSNAELDNLRKRNERELENAHRYALERFVAELLPVKDSMELGLGATSGEGKELEGIREGFELTLKMFSSALEKFAVEEVNPQGEVFDPELHQAMTTQEAAGVAPGMVVHVVQKGYCLNQRLVRPAMVIVSK